MRAGLEDPRNEIIKVEFKKICYSTFDWNFAIIQVRFRACEQSMEGGIPVAVVSFGGRARVGCRPCDTVTMASSCHRLADSCWQLRVWVCWVSPQPPAIEVLDVAAG